MTASAPRPVDQAEDVLSADPAVLTGGLVGYARVSTSAQLLDRQTRALAEAGCVRVFADKRSGRDAERPELTACLAYLRPGDVLVVPSLDRLARSLQDLIALVGELRRRGVGFRSLHESLDTTTPGGRLVFHIFAALAEFIRELIVEGTHEGLAAAKARGVRLGRPPAMTPEQIRSARDLLTRPENTVSSIARLLGVSRSTIYKYVPEATTGAAAIAQPQPQAVNRLAGQPSSATPSASGLACPSCGHRPTSRHELAQHREDLDTVWLLSDPDDPAELVERRHCSRCQPHQVEIVMCPLCSTAVMLGGELAERGGHGLAEVAVHWLTARGWRQHADRVWMCGGTAKH
jgi:DNA invertase Pin-like site-specific DNA recombinase